MNPQAITSKATKVRAFTLGVLWGLSASSQALTIPDTPLFLANDIQPNIFFALDDSGSMDWEILKSNGARIAHPTTRDDGNLLFNRNNDTKTEDREHCAGYNVMAYNPTATYTPWKGVDNAGVAFANQTITAARLDPFNPGAGTTNLTNLDSTPVRSAMYGVFVDTNGNGQYDSGECPVSSSADGTRYRSRTYSTGGTGPRFVFISSLSAAEQTNYANWYSFYRKREFVLKRAISQLIFDSNQRMGLATLHNNNTVGTPVADMSVAANKSLLLSRLINIDSLNGTPLRTLLRNVGRYFDQAGSNSDHSALGFSTASPILPAADGGECQQNFAVMFTDGFYNGSFTGGPGNTDADGAGVFDGGPHADTDSNTLADVAMDYYERDLSTSLPNKVPTITNVDENDKQHMVTYTVSFGLKGSLTAPPADHEATTAPPPWPTPVDDTLTTADDLMHAAFNSRGLHLAGQDPQEVIDGLAAALNDIGARTGSASAVAATSQSIQEGTLIFQGRFDTDNWNGQLTAINFEVGGIVGTTEWEASTLIPTENSRQIFTFKDTSTVDGVEFEWTNLTTAQQTAIGSATTVNYVRGDRTLEIASGGTLRDRVSLLGDIIFSGPSAVTPDQFTPPYEQMPGAEGDDYPAFLGDRAEREGMVYVGANDGMLHAFKVEDGVEEFAYVPQAVFSNLSALSSPSYSHKFYVDGAITTGDAYFSGAWHTMLVGALGRGGKAVFGLDVSDPTSFNGGDVKWELTHAELGQVLGRATIARMANGKWAAIVGNGYNSTSHKAQLFIIDIHDGSIIKIINTTVGSATLQNGLGGPLVIDDNRDFIADFIYAGDLQGNLWKFDVSSTSTSAWGVDLGGSPLYTAKNTDGNPQAITIKPSLAVNPADGSNIILIGTGRYFVTGDDAIPAEPTVDTFYGILDADVAVSSVGARSMPDGDELTVGPSTILQAQEIVFELTDTFDGVENSVRVISQNPVDYTTQHGWYLDLVSPINGNEGEKVIADTQVRPARNKSPLIIFNTFVPAEGCETAGGKSFLMAFDAVNGGRPNFPIFDLNNDGVFDDNDFYIDADGKKYAVSGSMGGPTVAPVTTISSAGRDINYAIRSGLDGDLSTNALEGLEDQLGRQSWRQLK
jgi:type IV pilus assembly protein PilY1